MNILPLNSLKLFSRSSVNNNKGAEYNSTNTGLKMSKPLSADTVSFKARMVELIEAAADKTNKELRGVSTKYMDVLEVIAGLLKDFGVSFDRSYCEPYAIKTASSVVSKIIRSGSFHVPDRIRATVYSKNIYDLSILIEKILMELDKRNYVLAENPMHLKEAVLRGYRPTSEDYERGYVLMPDLDIRLDMRNEDIKPYILPEELKYSMGEKQPSGYEDIQLRLVKVSRDENGKIIKVNQNRQYELLILVGKNYSNAKKDESAHIYNYTRQFKELHIFQKDKSDKEVAKVKDLADKIKDIFSTEISQKVYGNAKSRDRFGTSELIPINLGKENEDALTACYDALEESIRNYYENLIELRAKNKKKLKQIVKDYQEDMTRLKNIRIGLTNAVDFYKNYSSEVQSKKPKKS